jgi:hypothetical protein
VARLLHDEGLSRDALDVLESMEDSDPHKGTRFSAFQELYWIIQTVEAARTGDWVMGLAAWEQWAEREIIASLRPHIPAPQTKFGAFFIAYAESLAASGDAAGGVRYAKKALRLNLDGNPEVAKRAVDVIGEG